MKVTKLLLADQGHAHQIVVAPDQPTTPCRAEIVERQIELGWQNAKPVEPDSGAMVGDIADRTAEQPWLPGIEQQRIAVERRASGETAFIPALTHDFLESRFSQRFDHRSKSDQGEADKRDRAERNADPDHGGGV